MRKLSLLLGSLGGALAGYLLSNDKLRKDLAKSKDAEHAAKTLGMHLSRDGKKVAQEVKQFVDSDDVQKNVSKVKSYASKKLGEAKKSLRHLVKRGTKAAKDMAADGAAKARTAVKKAAKKMEKDTDD